MDNNIVVLKHFTNHGLRSVELEDFRTKAYLLCCVTYFYIQMYVFFFSEFVFSFTKKIASISIKQKHAQYTKHPFVFDYT